jgi:hypothetical protein
MHNVATGPGVNATLKLLALPGKSESLQQTKGVAFTLMLRIPSWVKKQRHGNTLVGQLVAIDPGTHVEPCWPLETQA